ncbi:MAG: hypothetical protein WAN65_01620 [Candidatus Sulfotelmatobacter sp.]
MNTNADRTLLESFADCGKSPGFIEEVWWLRRELNVMGMFL